MRHIMISFAVATVVLLAACANERTGISQATNTATITVGTLPGAATRRAYDTRTRTLVVVTTNRWATAADDAAITDLATTLIETVGATAA